jgi:dynein heavy chain, axonemal
MYPISYEHCFNTLITKEVQRYNILLQVVYLSMKNTLKALEGVIHINSALEDVYRSLTYEHVPSTWYKYCYQPYKSLPLFLENLKDRVEFIRSFLKKPKQEQQPQSPLNKNIFVQNVDSSQS